MLLFPPGENWKDDNSFDGWKIEWIIFFCFVMFVDGYCKWELELRVIKKTGRFFDSYFVRAIKTMVKLSKFSALSIGTI